MSLAAAAGGGKEGGLLLLLLTRINQHDQATNGLASNRATATTTAVEKSTQSSRRAQKANRKSRKSRKPNRKLKPTEASALHRGSFASFNADDVMRVATVREGEGVKKRQGEGQSLTGFGLGIWHAAGNLR